MAGNTANISSTTSTEINPDVSNLLDKLLEKINGLDRLYNEYKYIYTSINDMFTIGTSIYKIITGNEQELNVNVSGSPSSSDTLVAAQAAQQAAEQELKDKNFELPPKQADLEAKNELILAKDLRDNPEEED